MKNVNGWTDWEFEHNVPTISADWDGDAMFAIEEHTADNRHLDSRLDTINEEWQNVASDRPIGYVLFDEITDIGFYPTLEAAKQALVARVKQTQWFLDDAELAAWVASQEKVA